MADELTENEYKAFSWIKGEMGQHIVEKKFFSNLDKEIEIIDGHKPHIFSNFDPHESYKPQHLDIVGIDRRNNEMKFICEVKTTITTNKVFSANGLCMFFMEKAKEKNIPIHFAVVRLNRDLDKRIIKSCNAEGECEVDEELYNAEFEYFLKNAKIEFYNENEFEMKNNKFIIKQQ